MKTIKLQGISAPQPAIEARELKPGMTRLYNFGETGEIVSVTPSKTRKTVTVTVREKGQEYTHRMNAGTLVAVAQDETQPAATKKSEAIKAEIDAINAEYDETIQRMVYQNPKRTAENHDAIWKEFWRQYGSEWTGRIKHLESDFNRELNRELEVGDGVTMHLWSDAHACTIIARTSKTLTIQRDRPSGTRPSSPSGCRGDSPQSVPTVRSSPGAMSGTRTGRSFVAGSLRSMAAGSPAPTVPSGSAGAGMSTMTTIFDEGAEQCLLRSSGKKCSEISPLFRD